VEQHPERRRRTLLHVGQHVGVDVQVIDLAVAESLRHDVTPVVPALRYRHRQNATYARSHRRLVQPLRRNAGMNPELRHERQEIFMNPLPRLIEIDGAYADSVAPTHVRSRQRFVYSWVQEHRFAVSIFFGQISKIRIQLEEV
jgi:hypothetical protein